MRVPGFVACAACGTRIKAGRGRCLRCGESLEAAQAPRRVERSRTWSERQRIVLGAVASAFAIGAAVVVWETRAPGPGDTGIHHPARQVTPPAAAPSAEASSPEAPAQAAERVESSTFIDSTRAATAAFTTGGFDLALASYEAALAKRPDDPEILNNMGQALVRLGRVDEALGRFERASALSPEKWAYRFNLAHTAAQLGQWDRAVAEYREAERLFPSDYATVFNLAMALHKKGDEPAAIAEFQKAIQLAPGETGFHVSLAISLEAAGKVNGAIAEFRTYLEMAPSAPDAAQVKAHVDALVAAQRPAAQPAS